MSGFLEKLQTFPSIKLTREQLTEAYKWGNFNASDGKYNNTCHIGTKKTRTKKEMAYDFFIGKACESAFKQFALQKYGFDVGKLDLMVRGDRNYDDSDFTVNGLNIDVKANRHFHTMLSVKKDMLDNKLKSGRNAPDFFVVMQYEFKEKLDGIFHFRGFISLNDLLEKGDLLKPGDLYAGQPLNNPLYAIENDKLNANFDELIKELTKVKA